MNPAYVQYGCGWSAPEGWRNFDASPTLRFERLPIVGRLYTKNARRFPDNVEYGDIVRGLPVVDRSCRAVYCSHVLEHLSLADFRVALTNTIRLLQPGGIFRLVVPDLELTARAYLAREGNDAASWFMRETCLGQERRQKGVRAIASCLLGNSAHLWMWDFRTMAPELASAGFVDIRSAALGDASDPMFREVEESDRWTNALGIECRCPD